MTDAFILEQMADVFALGLSMQCFHFRAHGGCFYPRNEHAVFSRTVTSLKHKTHETEDDVKGNGQC